MSRERTLSIIKPDAVRKHFIGRIIAHFEQEGLVPIGLRLLQLSRADAERFYAVHEGKPFYQGLVEFMTSGPCLPMVLEGEDAIEANRRVMGATDPAKAAPGSLRAMYAESVRCNAVHGSDSKASARVEIAFFFPDLAPE
jgi:nucleoside-diphosphate kinase